MATWKTPAQIVNEITRRWNKGHLLVPPPDLTFPWRIPIPPPAPREMTTRHDEIKGWYRLLAENQRGSDRAGYRLTWTEVNNRQIGLQTIPDAAIIDTLNDALTLIDKTQQAARFHALIAHTDTTCPALIPWMQTRPLLVIEYADDWEKLTAAVGWFSANPRAGIYLRQIDLPGIDTKFIENRYAIMSNLLDAVLPVEAIDVTRPPRFFAERYGLRTKPLRVPLRLLDSALAVGGLTEVTAPLEHVAGLPLTPDHLFLVENEITGLAFPPVPGGALIYGMGNAIELIASIPWLNTCPVWYWGDIDTHGFAILSRLRSALPHVQSFLMDESTLIHHLAQCVIEDVQDLSQYPHLTVDETALLNHLRADTFGRRRRLEQERVSWGWMKNRLRNLLPA